MLKYLLKIMLYFVLEEYFLSYMPKIYALILKITLNYVSIHIRYSLSK